MSHDAGLGYSSPTCSSCLRALLTVGATARAISVSVSPPIIVTTTRKGGRNWTIIIWDVDARTVGIDMDVAILVSLDADIASSNIHLPSISYSGEQESQSS